MKSNASLKAVEGDEAPRCPVCGTPYPKDKDDEGCPVCLLRQAMQEEATLQDDTGDEGRFDHYELARPADGSCDELGCGARGVTSKHADTDARLPVAVKVIEARLST